MTSLDLERMCNFWSGRIHGEQDPQGLALQYGGSTLLKGELRHDLRLSRDLGSHTCAHGWGATAFLTKNSEAENTVKRTNAAQLTSRGQCRLDNLGQNCC